MSRARRPRMAAADRYGTKPSDVYALLVEDVGMRIFDADGTRAVLGG
jgi:hypothetical protein